MEWVVRFALPNGGPGPDTVASEDLAAEFDGLVVLLLRDHYCQVSRDRARAYSDAFDEFAAEDVAVIAALPDSRDRAAFWRERYDLSFPVLADPAATPPDPGADAEAAAEADADAGIDPDARAGPGAGARAMTDGTNRFDAFADVEAGVDSLPGIGILATGSGFPRLVYSEGGETIQECPDPDEALAAVRDVLD